MRKLNFSNLVFGVLVLTGAPVGFAVAHEDHQMKCDETSMNAMHADIQSMNDGEAKTTAMKEMQMADEMMAKKDMKACATHMHNAMEATEK
ncbi:hypothetical protein [Methyloceanibacter sp.]|uniref:hypothetical protein n=1 Tax=Methyloceanibacter sp. TaxID=1965321 RepID=UPI003D6CCFFC